jgi:excisionase family DNA binding protein
MHMPRTKHSKPAPTPKPEPQPAAVNGPPGEVLTLAEAAAYLRLPEGEVLRVVREQGLHARQVGSEWRFLKSAINDWLRAGGPPTSNKEAWLGLAGAWKEDPFLEEFLEEIARQRKRWGPGDDR